ncbi:MAG: AAA family ATPase [Pseudomonadota bacterium]
MATLLNLFYDECLQEVEKEASRINETGEPDFSKIGKKLVPCIDYILSAMPPKNDRINFNKLMMVIVSYFQGAGFSRESAMDVVSGFLAGYRTTDTYDTVEKRQKHFVGQWEYNRRYQKYAFECSYVKGLKLPGSAFDCRKCEIGGSMGPEEQAGNGLKIVSASTLLNTEPPEPDQIFGDTFDAGDKVAIIGSSKLRKSFLLLQAALSISTGRDFLRWKISQTRRVFYCQFELTEAHFHRRLKRLSAALGITAGDVAENLQIFNARGSGIAGPDGIEKIAKAAEVLQPEVFVFDPLYKLVTGKENAAEDFKIILNAFDVLAEASGAAVLYVHHDAKGSPGDRDIRDRGAGSNVLGRDYDACITITAHSQEEFASVVEILLRNYRPQDPFTISWNEDFVTGGYRFEERPDILPSKKTSKTRPKEPELSIYLPTALDILGDQEMEIKPFKDSLKEQAELTRERLSAFLNWATAGGKPKLITREQRGHGVYRKWIRAAEK